MKNYIESKWRLANQAELPGALTLLFFAICSANLLVEFIEDWNSISFAVLKAGFKGNKGTLSLKRLIHIPSKKALNTKTKVTVAMVSTIKNHLPVLFQSINIKATQQIKSLINRVLGKFLAYASSCSGVICQSSGTALGNLVQILSLSKYKIISKINPTAGYEITAQPKICDVLKCKLIIIDTIIAAIILKPVAINPELAMILGLLKKVLKSIYSPLGLACQLKPALSYKIAHNQLEQYVYIPQSISWRQQYV
jgi:hypothetical protein